MVIVVFHGSPRKGNTYFATKVLMEELEKRGDVHFYEFFLPAALPSLCEGCALCLGESREKCPHAQAVTPIVNAMMDADGMIFATPHYGACSMPGSMKNLLDHLAFLELNVSPRAEMFHKKAIVLTTGAGSTAAIKPIQKFLRHWGVNRVYSLGFRMFTNRWDQMPKTKQARFERVLRLSAKKFYTAPKGSPYLSTVFHYYIAKFILKKYVGEGNYPYEYWKEKGYFKKRPF